MKKARKRSGAPKLVLENRLKPVAFGLSDITMPVEPKASILWSKP